MTASSHADANGESDVMPVLLATSPTSPATSLVIPSRNRGDLLFETVESVLGGDQVPTEIIVVDQSDDPDVRLQLLADSEHTRVRYLWSRDSGVSKARNRGIREAKYDALLFVDDDMRVTPSWCRELVGALVEAGPTAAVTGRVLPEAPADGDGFVPSTIDDPDPVLYAGRIGTDILYSNNMALWRSMVEAVGDFDERLGGGAPFRNAEDNEFAFRLLEAGFRIQYTPKAVSYHRAWRSKADYHPLCWSYGYGQGAYYAKHMGLRDRHMLWRFRHDLGQRFLRMLRFARREPHRAVGQFVYMAGMVTGGSRWLWSRAVGRIPGSRQGPG